MSKKWVEREGLRWVEQQIVTREQYERILSLYDGKKQSPGLLPIFGSILVGLGVLSFIAANWQDIAEGLRLAIIIAAMAGFYAAGERLAARGQEKLGIALIGIGLISFGGGIVLVGQMFHLLATGAGAMIVWGVTGMVLTYLYRSRYLFTLSLIIFNIAQLYSTISFHTFSYTALALMTAGLGFYIWKVRQSALLMWLLNVSLMIQSLILIVFMDWKPLWILIPALLLYAAGDWLGQRDHAGAFQAAPLIAAFLMGVFLVLFYDEAYGNLDSFRADASLYLPVLLALLAVSAAGKYRRKREVSAAEWLLFLPLIYSPALVELLYLVALFLFSLYVLWRGYSEEWGFKINVGTVLFIFTTMIAYGKLTWDFMDKSLFFVIGGVILLALSWFLNRRRRRFFSEGKEGER
ncbi:DUF2157 domain-containing protein [Paenibacillus hamazuiensis]|uniref:DUF2157 domain-containing protein n=1 Tax=Paenibacillus hamazuiensis TaxID=2936508 RepID=UPI00200DCE8A|nr:DUF2157 domain-containing protein [Paenibacillus hamazuiensis]